MKSRAVIKRRNETAASPPTPARRSPGAPLSPADLFRRAKDFEAFRRALLDLDGAFPFSSADMIDLGRAYFERCPDREQDRNIEEVRLGYAVVRAAIAEQAVLAVAPPRRDAYRSIFNDAAAVGSATEALLQGTGLETALADLDALAGRLAELKAEIDEIPKGMIKERFVGGISYFFNVLFAVEMSLRSRLPR